MLAPALARPLASLRRGWRRWRQPVDLRTRWFLTLLKLDRGRHEQDPPEKQRAVIELIDRVLGAKPLPMPITPIEVPLAGRTLRARVYRGVAPSAGAAPAILYLHGGGFVTGSPEGYERFCSRLASEGACVVVSLDYRLAPEHRYPAAVDDVVDAWGWLRAQAPALGLDPERLAVGGDSAGGNLAAVLSNRMSGGDAPKFQLLLYPGTDMPSVRESRRTFAEGYYLTSAHVEWFFATYLPDTTRWTEPDASPLRADPLGQVPAIIVTAGLDPLRDDGRDYADKLRAAGVHVEALEATGLPHGFINLDGVLPDADRRVAEVCARVRARWPTAEPR